jgi:ABC-type branched-subunit amino acid transport system substrate-binding protein
VGRWEVGKGLRCRLATALAVALAGPACVFGSSPAPSGQNFVDVGLVVSLTGANSATAGPAVQGATVALARANADHLAGSRQLRFVRVDDGSNPDAAAKACSDLVLKDHVVAIVGFELGASLDACNRAAAPANVPYFAGVPPGTVICYPNVFVFGFTPSQQVMPLIDYLVHKQLAKTFYVVATDDPLARSATARAAASIQGDGGVLLGSTFRPAQTTDFGPEVAKIAAARPDVVLDALISSDLISFHRQFGANPRAGGTKQASLWLDGAAARSIGPAAVGLVVSQDYNSADPSPANKAWLAALVGRFGDGAVPTSIGAEVYDATLSLASAIDRAQSTSGAAITSAVSGVSIDGPRGPIQVAQDAHGYASVSAHIGRVNASYAIDVVDVSGPVQPQACG